MYMIPKKYIIFWCVEFLLLFFLMGIINFYVLSASEWKIYYLTEDIQGYDVGLVLGASVYDKHTPSPILSDRLDLAYDLYYLWKIQKILVSWDNAQMEYNEPIAMKNYLLYLWVDPDDIYLDYAGFNTYDSIYRAKHIFWVEKMVILTQEFHVKRAVYIANQLGIDGIWVEDDTRIVNYNYEIREFFSRVKAFINVEVLKSKSKYAWEQIKIISDEEIRQAKETLLQ